MNHARESSRRLSDLLRSEHGAMADFLVALAEFDRGRLWVQLGHSSVFYYLHRDLGLSKGAAHYRKVAAHLIQRFPEVVGPLRDGRLCIASVVERPRVITPENSAEIVPKFFNRSKQEAKAVAVEICPAEVIPRREVVTEVPCAAAFHPDETPLAVRSQDPSSPVPPAPPAPPAPPRSEPLTSDLRRLHMTVSKQFLEKLEAARRGQGGSEESAAEPATREEPRPHPRRGEARRLGAGRGKVPMAPRFRRHLRLHDVPRDRPHPAARQIYGDDWMNLFTKGNNRGVPIAREAEASWMPYFPAARAGPKRSAVPGGSRSIRSTRSRGPFQSMVNRISTFSPTARSFAATGGATSKGMTIASMPATLPVASTKSSMAS
jgi:hypothetical protein